MRRGGGKDVLIPNLAVTLSFGQLQNLRRKGLLLLLLLLLLLSLLLLLLIVLNLAATAAVHPRVRDICEIKLIYVYKIRSAENSSRLAHVGSRLPTRVLPFGHWLTTLDPITFIRSSV